VCLLFGEANLEELIAPHYPPHLAAVLMIEYRACLAQLSNCGAAQSLSNSLWGSFVGFDRQVYKQLNMGFKGTCSEYSMLLLNSLR